MPNQALEQTRDNVLRYGESVGCELLNFFVRLQKGQIEMFQRSLVLALLSLPLAGGCLESSSDVATKLGYKKSSKIAAGPYQLHHGQADSDEFVLLSKGKQNLFSWDTGQGADVYLNGLPFIHFDRGPDGAVSNLTLNVFDANGKEVLSLIDHDADGEWDIKIDHGVKKKFVRKDGQWVSQ